MLLSLSSIYHVKFQKSFRIRASNQQQGWCDMICGPPKFIFARQARVFMRAVCYLALYVDDNKESHALLWTKIFWTQYGKTLEAPVLLLTELVTVVKLSETTFHTSSAEKSENAAFFLLLDSTLICHENEAFQKRSSKRRVLKTPALRWFYCPNNTNPKWLVIVVFPNFCGVAWTENNNWCVFRAKTPLSNFCGRGMDEA